MTRITSPAMAKVGCIPQASALGDAAKELGISPITLAIAGIAHSPTITAPILSVSKSNQLQPSLDAMDYKLDAELYACLTNLAPTPAPTTDRSEEA